MALNSVRVNSQRFAPSGATYQQRPRTGVNPTASASPAIDAMRQTGQMPTSPGGMPQAAAPGAAVGATPATQVPGVNVAQVDTSKMDTAYGQQDATYDRMLADQQKMWGDTQNMIQQNFSGSMRRNASNAARQGLSLGGASYLSGQRSALNQAGNYARQANMDSLGQRIGIMGQQAGAYGQRAGAYGQVAGQNTSATNAANLAQWGEERAIDREKGAAQAERNKNDNIAAVQDVKTKFEYLFNKNNYRGGEGQFRSLMGEYEAALNSGTDAEIAAAYNNLIAYVTPYQQAREAWLAAGGEKKMGSFENYFNTNYRGR